MKYAFKFNKFLTALVAYRMRHIALALVVVAILCGNVVVGYAEGSSGETAKSSQFLDKVEQELELNKTDYRQLLNNVADTKMRLDLLTEEKTTLQGQLAILDARVVDTNKQLLAVTKQVVQKENEIALLYEQININQVAADYQSEQLKDYIRTIYQEENAMISHGKDGGLDAFKLLLTDGSVGENMRQLNYFNVLDEAGQQMVVRLDELGKNLEAYKEDLEKKRVKLDGLQSKLLKEKQELDLEQRSKVDLLEITMGQEEVFKKLLEQTIKQQDEMVQDIKSLNNALEFLKDRMILEGASFDIAKYKSILDFRTQALYEFQMSTLGDKGGKFTWPVAPDRGISAYFHDPRYVGVFGVQHNAVDIPEYQGTPVHATADGVVYAARDNGYGYSYVILAHAGGFMTVYGHVSSILVSVGDKIDQGSIIALSGGMPGTIGAGYMTTGPHLHFEVHFEGKNVDPLSYLPLYVLTKEQIDVMPQEYQARWNTQMAEEAGLVSRGGGWLSGERERER